MTESDLAVQEVLGSLVPARTEAAEWDDVLRRAGAGRKRGARRPLVLALAVLALTGLAVSPVGTAIADGVDGFAAWISGEPGTPASSAEQQAFEQANERTWVKFAPGTKLRRLLETEVSGTAFTLYGFRSGDDLCLRLVARGAASATSTHCAPLHALQTARAPVVVVATDEGIGPMHVRPNADGFVPDAYSASFGIASDGVSQVLLRGDDGTHEALLGGNGFLYVDDHPKAGTRVRSAEAVAANGSRAALGLQSAPYGEFDLPAPPTGRPQGPTHLDRKVDGVSIGWIERREPRGEPLPPAHLKSLLPLAHSTKGGHIAFARVLEPDPADYVRVAVVVIRGESASPSLVCTMTIDRTGGGGGCSQPPRLFPRWPFTLSVSNSGSAQYSLLSGLASDDVARLALFGVDRAPLEVPLRDNVWLVRVGRSDFPIRLVAYDGDGRVIGVHVEQSDGMTSPAPRAAQTSVRTLARVAGENGQTATLRAGRPVGGYRCWNIEVSNRGGGGGCTRWPQTGRPLLTVEGASTHGDFFLTGALTPSVASLSLTFAPGETLRVEPISGFLVYAVPHRFVGGDGVFVTLRAYDGRGNLLGTRGLTVSR